MKFNSIIKFYLFSLFLFSTSALSYTFTVTNATDETIAIEIHGIVAGNMMKGSFGPKGLFPGQNYKERRFGNTLTITNAGHLDGPYKIPHNHTVKFEFSNWDVGVCFDLSNAEVGLQSNGFNMVSADVVALPNDWYNHVFSAVSQTGGNIALLGKAIGQKLGGAIGKIAGVDPEPESKAVIGAVGAAAEGVGMAAQAIGQMIGSVGSLIRSSSCKDMSFIAVKKDRYEVSLLTRQL